MIRTFCVLCQIGVPYGVAALVRYVPLTAWFGTATAAAIIILTLEWIIVRAAAAAAAEARQHAFADQYQHRHPEDPAHSR